MRIIKADIVVEDEGIGAKARRPIPGKIGHLDPFVLFDDYDVYHDAYFPMHPHGGFEGFQVLREGRTRYEDHLGQIGHIDPGDVRRFVAGKNFQHSETPEYDGTTRGYLLWIKLPESEKDTDVIFREERSKDIPVREEDGLRIRTIMGRGSPVRTLTPVLWEIMESSADSSYDFEKAEDENGFFYVTRGAVDFDGESYRKESCLVLEGSGASSISISEDSEVVFIKGRKLNEPIVQKGHYVK